MSNFLVNGEIFACVDLFIFLRCRHGKGFSSGVSSMVYYRCKIINMNGPIVRKMFDIDRCI